MSIKIIDEPEPLRLTREEYERGIEMYNKFKQYCVSPPSFETWMRRQKEEEQNVTVRKID